MCIRDSSSATAALPACVAFYKQPAPVAIVLINATVFSVLYHESEEEKYDVMDQIWANLSLLLIILGFVVMLRTRGVDRRVVFTLATAVLAGVMYALQGYREPGPSTEKYELYHSLWHIFSALAATSVVADDLDWGLVMRPAMSSLSK